MFESHKLKSSYVTTINNVHNYCLDPRCDSRRERQATQSCARHKCVWARCLPTAVTCQQHGGTKLVHVHVIVMKHGCSNMSVRNALMLYMHASMLTHDIAMQI